MSHPRVIEDQIYIATRDRTPTMITPECKTRTTRNDSGESDT